MSYTKNLTQIQTFLLFRIVLNKDDNPNAFNDNPNAFKLEKEDQLHWDNNPSSILAGQPIAFNDSLYLKTALCFLFSVSCFLVSIVVFLLLEI